LGPRPAQVFRAPKGGAAPIAAEALQRIAGLYAIEADIRGQAAEARKAARQQRSRPLALDLKLRLEARLTTVSGRSPIAEAIRYTLSRWEGLIRFLEDGRIELDSNPVEQTIRPIALNRKNALFAGSDEGAENWAVLATLIECCKLHGVNPTAYLTDILTRLVNGHLDNRLGELTPWAWQAANSQA
jgi:transposase